MMNEFQVYTEQSELKDCSSSSFVLTGCLGRCHGKEVWPHYFQVKVETPLPQLASTDTPEQEGVLYHHWAGTEFRVHTRPPRISGLAGRVTAPTWPHLTPLPPAHPAVWGEGCLGTARKRQKCRFPTWSLLMGVWLELGVIT